ITHKPTHNIGGCINANPFKISWHRRMFHSLVNSIEVYRRPAANQYQILPFCRALNPEHSNVRKHFAESDQHRSQTFIGQLIDLQPLHKNSVAAQTVAAQDEEFAGEKIRDARHPGMTGLAYDHVIEIRIDAQISSRVVNDQMQSRIAQRMIVDMLEVTR